MIPKGKGLPKYADDSTLNEIRGKAMVGHQSIEDVWVLLDHLQLLEHMLDEEIDPIGMKCSAPRATSMWGCAVWGP